MALSQLSQSICSINRQLTLRLVVQARLKVNGKFECVGLHGAEVKKGSREDNFPEDGHERLKLKYYCGDRDAAFEDEIPFCEIIKEKFDFDSCEQMMREVFMAWPTVDSPDDFYSDHGDKKPVRVCRKGKDIKTWPLSKDAFTAIVEGCSANCAMVAKSLTKEIIKHTEGTDACITWPDLQEAFKRAGHGAGLDHRHMAHPKVRLTLKIPEAIVKDVLEGEWRMYCKGDGITNHKPAFSYGMYITDVTEVAHEGHIKKFSFAGRSRVEGKWTVQNATAIWNEEHTGRVRLDYTEFWPGAKGVQPTEDKLLAHLKVNMKFECESTQGFIQKARREDTLPTDPEERMKNKYYIGDQDAAFEIDPNNVCNFDEWISEQAAAGSQEFLTHLFFQWPTMGHAEPQEVHRYGHKRKTWPITAEQVVAAVTHGGKYEEKVATGILSAMYDKNHCECHASETIMWPDFQVLFEHALGAATKDVHMLDKDQKSQFSVNLTLKIPEPLISKALCGEYRMYCKNVEANNSFSYGLIIDSVTETSCEANAFGTEKKTFTFIGRPRLDGKYVLKSGTAVWNEFGTGRLFLEYAEHWPDGMVDNLKARLKVNGKFACDSTSGFIQKARKEETLPVAAKLRMESKYYIGDQDAASD